MATRHSGWCHVFVVLAVVLVVSRIIPISDANTHDLISSSTITDCQVWTTDGSEQSCTGELLVSLSVASGQVCLFSYTQFSLSLSLCVCELTELCTGSD
jgi:hypothetical protein